MSQTLPPPGNPLYPLANSKGTNLLCELCQKPAFLQCAQCRVTYYCSLEHQRADWVGIHEKICENLIPLRKPISFQTSEDARQKRKSEINEKKREMIDLTLTTGQKLLFEGRHEAAVPAALQSLKFSIDVHGLASVELVPSYLILGEASIGLNRLPQAEEYLSQAQWTVLKTPQCPNSIRSSLHRNLGLLFAAKGDFDQALENLAHDIFYASEEYGTDDIRTSGGYFHMANVFYRQGQLNVSDDLYSRVTKIWYDYLYKIVKSIITPPEIPEGIGEVVAEITQEEKETLDEAQEAEAVKVLNAIHEIRERSEKTTTETIAHISHALSMLYFVINHVDRAREFGQKAIAASEGLEDNTLSNHVMELMQYLEV